MTGKTVTLVLGILFLSGFGLAAGLIDAAGQPFTRIVVAADAPDSVTLAATELQHFIRRRCGAELPIATAAAPGEAAIYLGRAAAALPGFPAVETLPPEGFRIGSSPGVLAIAGRDYAGPPIAGLRNPWRLVESYNPERKLSIFGEAGTLSGVYDFLEQEGGIRFYWPGESGIVCDPVETWQIGEFEREKAPRFDYRYAWFAMFEDSPESALWARRVGFGAPAPVMIIHSYDFFLKYKDTHPEYFALADGKRAFGSECVADGHGHLCLTNPAVIRQWADDIIAYFEAHPEVEVYPLAPNDGLSRICECSECQKELRPEAGDEGRFSYHIWNFTGKVAALVAERFPDKFVGCLAYEHYRKVPEELTLPPNVAVMFCHARSDLADPVLRDRLHREIEAWSQRAGRVYLWDWYLTHWQPWNDLPILYSATIQEELRYLAANPKIHGEFIENEGPGALTAMNTPGMQHLNMYLTAKLYWEPELDTDAVLAEYFTRFYGPGAAEMERFWRRAEEERNRLLAASVPLRSPDVLFTPAFLEELNGYLDAAAAKVEPDSIYGQRIKVVRDEFLRGRQRLTRLMAEGRRRYEMAAVADPAKWLPTNPVRFVAKSGEAATPPTWMAAGYDRKNLYLKILCFEPHMGVLQSRADAGHPEALWTDDIVEVFFAAAAEDGAPGWQIVVNPNAYRWEQRKTGVISGDPSWTSGATAQVTREDNRWQIDLAIPWRSIGINDPNFTGTIACNIYRTRVAGGAPQVSCWSPTGEFAHYVPAQFGTLSCVH